MRRFLSIIAILAIAGGWTHGRNTSSQRIVLNTTFVDNTFDYQFVNHIQVAGNGIGPVDTFWTTPGNSPQWSSAILDSAGWPNTAGVTGHSFGNHVLLPASTNYSTYVITWSGQGQLSLTVGTWTTTSITGTGCVTNSNGNWTGQDCRVEVTYSGAQQQVGWRTLQTNQSGGGYFRNLKFFRAADETDLNAGKIFRAPYKQIIASMNPSAIRVMNWTGGNDATQNRFENRSLPTYATYGGGVATVSPPYQETSTANLMTLPSAAGMPVSMQHGEIVTARIGVGEVRAGNITVSAITKANPGVVTATAHGFSNGDTVVFVMPSTGASMAQLDHWNVTATVTDADHFSIGVDTTSFTTFTSGNVSEYASLNVGGRGAFPVVSTDGSTPLAMFGSNNFMIAGDYRTFYFDKKLAASRDGGGNLIFGAWMTTPATNGGTASYNPYQGGVPLEICTALVNEVNALSASSVALWLTIPHWGLSSMDPDYSAASNFPANAVQTVINGANGFAGLASRAALFVENSNERWNTGGSFKQTFYYERVGFLTYGGSQTDTSSYSAVRSVIAATDIKAAIATTPRVKFVQGIQGGAGYSGGSPNVNYTQGSANYFADPHIVALSTPLATPISYHDYMAFASYFDPPSGTDYMTKVTGGFTDDSALYATGVPANQATAIANFVTQVTSGTNGQSINLYTGLLTTYAAAMVSVGNGVIQYEGAQDWAVAVGATQGSHAITAADSTFLLAIQGSSNWATALTGYYANFKTTTGALMPALYVMIDPRWGYTSINNTVVQPDDYSGGVEGGALNATWTAFGTYNAGLQ